MIKLRNLDPSVKSQVLMGAGAIPGAADQIFICKSTGQAYTYWNGISPEKVKGTISAAHDFMTSGRNDVAILSPDSHSQAEALTWSKNECHLIGAFGPHMMNHRSRIGHSDDFATLLTVSGEGNTFANLYFMHGRGSATNLNLLTVSGNRNSFINCHFGGPMHATEGAAAGYDLVRLAAAETYFKSCTFGIDTIATTTMQMIEFGAQAEPPRAIFDDCLFLVQGDANVRFLKVVAGAGRGLGLFRNCQFINLGTAMDYGIDGAGLNNYRFHFANCGFEGCTDIVEAAYEAYCHFSPTNYVAAAVNTGLSVQPDVS
jgi:hypothetical protein